MLISNVRGSLQPDTSGCSEFPDHDEPAAPWGSMRNYCLSSPGPPKSTILTGGEQSYAPSALMGPRGVACPVLSPTLRRVSINSVSRGRGVGSMRRREHEKPFHMKKWN